MKLPEHLLRLENIALPQGAVEKMYGMMLYGAMRNKIPEVVVELGTGKGYSTAWMLLGLEENEGGHIWSCDVIPADNPVWAQVNISSQKLTYFSNDPIETLKNKLPPEIDFIFHDAGHSLEEVKADLTWLLPRLKVGGSLVIHDVVYNPHLGNWLLGYFDSYTDEWSYERIEEGCGVGIATRIKQAEVKTCKDESNGLTIQKGSVLFPEKTDQIISSISPKSKRKVTARSKKIKVLYLSPNTKRKGRVRQTLSPNGAY